MVGFEVFYLFCVSFDEFKVFVFEVFLVVILIIGMGELLDNL